MNFLKKGTTVSSNPSHSKRDALLWGMVVFLTIVGIALNYHFTEVATPLKLAGWIVLVCVIAALAFNTAKGQALLIFAKEARIEMRKVVWPTRQETVQTTLVVVGMVVVMALLLWGVDSILLWAIGLITQRG